MSTYQYKTKQFKDLQSDWYKKLKEDGFVDAEQGDDKLKQWHSTAFLSRYDKHRFNSHEKYFALVGQFLHEHSFKTETDRIVWEQHSLGLSASEIHAVLKQKISLGRTSLFKIVQRLSKEMLEKYNNDDEND